MQESKRQLIKQEFSQISSLYFNTAYFGPSPLSAKVYVQKALRHEIDPSFYPYNDWMAIPERIRTKFALLVGQSENNFGLFNSTSDVISAVAYGYPYESGDVIVAIEGDYPSNVLPWMRLQETRKDIEFKLLKLGQQPYPTVEWLKENLPEKTKIFNISHVQFDTGKTIDILKIGQFLKERGIFFVVDATQALGGVAYDKELWDVIDVLGVSTYKWFLGPYGNAFGYFSDDALKKISYFRANWVKSPNSKVVYNLLDYTTETLVGARRFDRGQSPAMLINACLEASLDFFNQMGLRAIQEHNKNIRDYFLSSYPQDRYALITPPEAMTNIVCLKAKDIDSVELETRLKDKNVDISVRQGNLRLSFHLFNTKEQVDRLVDILDIK